MLLSINVSLRFIGREIYFYERLRILAKGGCVSPVDCKESFVDIKMDARYKINLNEIGTAMNIDNYTHTHTHTHTRTHAQTRDYIHCLEI